MMTRLEIMRQLGLKNPVDHAEQAMHTNVRERGDSSFTSFEDGMLRGTGRTTWMLVSALMHLMETNDCVRIHGHNSHMARDLYCRLLTWVDDFGLDAARVIQSGVKGLTSGATVRSFTDHYTGPRT